MDVRDFIAANAAEFSSALRDWLSIPSVSADPARHGDVGKSAQWLVDYLKETGFPVAEIWETDGLPAVYAHWPAADPAAKKVLVYGHHDVQPAARDDGWDYEPFAPQERDGKIFGRGASDDKGQVLFHALGVRAALAANGTGAPPVTLTLLVEGEEESGSPNFAKLLRERRDQLAPDVIVISDTTMWAADTPSICTGMRGLVDAEITVTGPARDLHSGSFGGGVPNPAHVLASLLAGLHDENGHITLPGFYDDVIPLSAEERALLAKLPFDEQGWLHDAGDSGAIYGEAGYTTLERIWARPTAEVNGLWGGPEGGARQAVVPPRRRPGTCQGRGISQKIPSGIHTERLRGVRHGRNRSSSVPVGHRLAGCGRGTPCDGAGVRQRGAVHQGGRQRPRGRPGRHPGRAARLRVRRP
jgi:acetylornithine deacetylase/succinyl-diaminopimelate desuccinylase-like protein